jgi:hypothetical protein
MAKNQNRSSRQRERNQKNRRKSSAPVLTVGEMLALFDFALRALACSRIPKFFDPAKMENCLRALRDCFVQHNNARVLVPSSTGEIVAVLSSRKSLPKAKARIDVEYPESPKHWGMFCMVLKQLRSLKAQIDDTASLKAGLELVQRLGPRVQELVGVALQAHANEVLAKRLRLGEQGRRGEFTTLAGMFEDFGTLCDGNSFVAMVLTNGAQRFVELWRFEDQYLNAEARKVRSEQSWLNCCLKLDQSIDTLAVALLRHPGLADFVRDKGWTGYSDKILLMLGRQSWKGESLPEEELFYLAGEIAKIGHFEGSEPPAKISPRDLLKALVEIARMRLHPSHFGTLLESNGSIPDTSDMDLVPTENE